MTKEIHFYESIEAVSASCNVLHYWDIVKSAIEKDFPEIHTTQMCMLSSSLLHRGYHMFVHQKNGVVYEITLKSKGGTGNHAVRDSQNVYGMWASNMFRIAKTVDDYVNATNEWNIQGLKYDIDGIIYEDAESIPCDVKNMTVDFYKYYADEDVVILKTEKE